MQSQNISGAAAMIATTVPQVTFDLRLPAEDLGQENPFRWEPTDTAELFGGRRVVVFAAPGAIHPGCTANQLLDYDARYGEFLKAGIDELYCVSVNEAPLVFQWAYSLDIWNVLMLPDSDGAFTRGMGMLARDRRGQPFATTCSYAAVVDDRRIERLFVDKGPACTCPAECCDAPDADTVLAWLRGEEAVRSRTAAWRHAFARG